VIKKWIDSNPFVSIRVNENLLSTHIREVKAFITSFWLCEAFGFSKGRIVLPSEGMVTKPQERPVHNFSQARSLSVQKKR
jgi:hypothetical protein